MKIEIYCVSNITARPYRPDVHGERKIGTYECDFLPPVDSYVVFGEDGDGAYVKRIYLDVVANKVQMYVGWIAPEGYEDDDEVEDEERWA
jgi:hypothetical protein